MNGNIHFFSFTQSPHCIFALLLVRCCLSRDEQKILLCYHQISFLRHLLGRNQILSPPDYVCRILAKAEMKTFMQMCFVQTFFDLRWGFCLFPCLGKNRHFFKALVILQGLGILNMIVHLKCIQTSSAERFFLMTLNCILWTQDEF